MSSNPALYRYIKFIGGNILDASNVTLLQTELERLGSQGAGQLYQQGALLNAVFSISGTSIVFQQLNIGFDVFVFINGQWEDLGATVTINGTQPSSGATNNLYLNWSWDIKTSSDDPTFLDGITGEPTIQAGQLSIDIDWVDTSGTPLNPSTQFAKNTSPIVLATFDMSVPSVVTVTYLNSVFPYAFGTPTQAGLTRLTDTSGLAPGNTDSRLSDNRTPLDHSVTDVKVKNLISSGFNSSALFPWAASTIYTVGNQIIDSNGNIETVVAVAGLGQSGSSAPTWNLTVGGNTIDNPGVNQITWVNGGTASTVKYDPATPNQGGIFSDHIIYTTLTESLTAFLDSVNTSIANALIALSNHIGRPLGSSETHPFPTASQVGAAPASHVGQVLGLGTSHPAQTNSDHGGFVTLRNPANPPNPNVGGIPVDNSFATSDGTNILSSLTHLGDVFSLLATSSVANGGNGSGGTAVNTGALGLLSKVAAVLAEHVNYKSHGNNNPHNLDAADIGSVDAAFVDQQVQSIIDDTTAYTDAKTNIAVRVVTTNGPAFPPYSVSVSSPQVGQTSLGHNPPGTTATQFPFTSAKITYVIITIGNGFEVAFGFGSYASGQQVALPEVTGWSSSNFYAQASVEFRFEITYDTRGQQVKAYVDPITRLVAMAAAADSGTNFVFNGIASIQAIGWRFLTPPPIIISSFDSTAGTFNSGHVGDTVIITGRNFGATQSGSTVRFNGTAVAIYNSWSSTAVSVVVPVGATTGLISMTVGANTVNSPFVFTIS